jgi:hypothetical protein
MIAVANDTGEIKTLQIEFLWHLFHPVLLYNLKTDDIKIVNWCADNQRNRCSRLSMFCASERMR